MRKRRRLFIEQEQGVFMVTACGHSEPIQVNSTGRVRAEAVAGVKERVYTRIQTDFSMSGLNVGRRKDDIP